MYEIRRDPIPGAEVRQESFGTPSVVFNWRPIIEGGKLQWACNPPEDDRDIAEDWVSAEGLGKRWHGRLVEVDAPSDLAVPQSQRTPISTLHAVFDAVNKLGEQNMTRILAGNMPTREPEWAKSVPAAVKEYLKTSPWPSEWRLAVDGQPHVEVRFVETFVEVARASAGKDEPIEDKSAQEGETAPPPRIEDGPKPTPDDQPKDAPQAAPADLSALLTSYGHKAQVPKAVAIVKDMLAGLNGVEPKIESVNYRLKKSNLPLVEAKAFPALLQAAKE